MQRKHNKNLVPLARTLRRNMTKEERRNPQILNGKRRSRIAQGSGTQVSDINKFMKSFEMTQKMLKKVKDEKSMKKAFNNLNIDSLKNFKM